MGSENIYSTVKAIREQYDSRFDQTWFRILLDSCPVNKGLLREIRVFLDSDPAELQKPERILYGVSDLECFIRSIEIYLLPNIKELLGVSALRPEYRLQDREQFIQRRLLAEVLPYNISVLKELVASLKTTARTETPPVFPDIPFYRTA